MLTSGRLGVQLSPEQASRLLHENVVGHLEFISLTTEEVLEILESCQSGGIRGGAVYDALHLAAARKSGAEEILTLNRRHFKAIAPDLEPLFREIT